MNRLICYSTSLLLLTSFISFSECIDPKLSFRMLIKDDASADLDLDYQNDEIQRVPVSLDCSFEGQTFKNGDQWKSSNNSCQLCHCEQGIFKCDLQECPAPACKQPIRVNDECCPICPNRFLAAQPETARCSLSANIFHRANAVWYSFIPPFGFDKCTVCTCLVSVLDLKLSKV